MTAHTSPIYVACGAEWEMFDQATTEYMLTLIEASLTYISELGLHYREGTVTHHHGRPDHQEFLREPFIAAQSELHRRMHQSGLQH
jgi:hypothetical protein